MTPPNFTKLARKERLILAEMEGGVWTSYGLAQALNSTPNRIATTLAKLSKLGLIEYAGEWHFSDPSSQKPYKLWRVTPPRS